MRTLRPNKTKSFAVVCGVLLGLLSALGGRAGADGANTPLYYYKMPPLPPTTSLRRFSPPNPWPTAIACMKMLPDGAHVCIHQKTVTALGNEHIYIEEVDRSSGIRIVFGAHYPPAELLRGDLVTVAGIMGTQDGERVVYAESEFDCDHTLDATIRPVAMASPAFMGWPRDQKEPEGDRVVGYVPIGLLVETWGNVTAKELIDEDGMWFLYLDDGWGKQDGNVEGYTGVRIYSDTIPSAAEQFQIAVGVLATKIYDPTPFNPGSGDEFVIPVIRCTGYDDLFSPRPGGAPQPNGPVTGYVRLVGQSAPGVDVRVYSDSSSVVVHGVTDAGAVYTLPRVPLSGAKISASATGYISCTREGSGDDVDVDFTLEKSDEYVEVTSDTPSISICSSEVALITAMLRDCEGKGIPAGQVKLTTTLGSFVDSGSDEIILTADSEGFAETRLTANPDSAGEASVKAQPYPVGVRSGSTTVAFIGPTITISADPIRLSQPGSSVISANLVDGGEPMADAPVQFKTDFGIFQETGTDTYSVYTDSDGSATGTLVLASAGTAKVTACYSNVCQQETMAWVGVAQMAAPWHAQGAQYSNPLVVDMDGDPDGKKEVAVVTSAGTLEVLKLDGTLYWSQPLHPPGSNTPACIAVDADRSGLPCLFVPAESQQRVHAFAHDGSALAGWPTGSNYRFLKVAASIGDINLDGSPEIIAGDECCYVFSWNPTGDWEGLLSAEDSFLWRNLTGTPSTAIFGSTCALGDLDDDPDGIPDVLVGTNRAPEVYAFPGDAWGDFVPAPLYLDGWPRNTQSRVETSPAVGDMDGDGKNDAVMGADNGQMYIWLSSDDSWTGYLLDGELKSSPALCDLDDDGRLDAVMGADSGRVYAFNWRGEAPDGWAGGIKLNCQGDYAVESSPTVGDVTGDGEINIVVGCNDGNVYALYKNGVEHRDGSGTPTGPIAWIRGCVPPGQVSAQVQNSPVIDDADNDGLVEVVAASDRGIYIFQFDVPYVQDPALYPWPTFHRDNQRTGCATAPPAPVNASIQGIVTKDGAPVTQAKVYIYNEDDSPVPQPHSTPPVARVPVLTVGGADPAQRGRGAYCISQLESNRTYKLKVVAAGEPDKWVPGVAVTTGLLRVDIAL